MNSMQYYEDRAINLRDTLNFVSSHWIRDEQIRFLYKNLANFVYRDLQYYLQDNEEKERQFSFGFIDRFPGVVCYTLADFYCTIYREFGIEANVVQANSAAIPLFGVVVRGDLGNYFLNPLEDLFLNQYGLMPHAFGFVPKYKTLNTSYPDLVRLSNEYIADLDKGLGFTYLDDYFNEIKPKMKNFSDACLFLRIEQPIFDRDIREPKVEFFSNNLINKGNVNGFFERAQLYQFLNETLLNRRERRYVKHLIEDGLSDNPYISYKIIKSSDEIILYREKKTPNGYILTKKH